MKDAKVIFRAKNIKGDILGERPDFKVCTQNYAVETEAKWSVGLFSQWEYQKKIKTIM